MPLINVTDEQLETVKDALADRKEQLEDQLNTTELEEGDEEYFTKTIKEHGDALEAVQHEAPTPLAVLDDGETETIGDIDVIDFTWIRDVDMGGYEVDDLRRIQDKFRAFGDLGQGYIDELDGIIQRRVDEEEEDEESA